MLSFVAITTILLVCDAEFSLRLSAA